jgi:hypothetical protein
VRQSPANERVILYRRKIEVGDDTNIQWSFNKIDETTEITSTDIGFTFSPVGQVLPPGEEHNTIEYELAKWAIKEEIFDKAFQDGSSNGSKNRITYKLVRQREQKTTTNHRLAHKCYQASAITKNRQSPCP